MHTTQVRGIGLDEEELDRDFPIVVCVPQDSIQNVFGTALALLWESMQIDGRYTPEALFSDLSDGSMQLWFGGNGRTIEAAMVTRIATFPLKKVCYVLWFGGSNTHKYLQEHLFFEQWAAKIGCDEIYIEGRPGWARLLRKFGYKPPKYVAVSKNLTLGTEH